MNATEIKAICVWFDETSEVDSASWIVSNDILGSSTTTIKVFGPDEKAEAIEFALTYGQEKGLPVYRLDPNGQHYPIGE